MCLCQSHKHAQALRNASGHFLIFRGQNELIESPDLNNILEPMQSFDEAITMKSISF